MERGITLSDFEMCSSVTYKTEIDIEFDCWSILWLALT